MKILIDAREAVRNKSGIGVVARKIISRLDTADTDIEFIVARPSQSRLFNTKPGRLIEFLWWKTVHIRLLAIWHKCDYTFSLDPINTVFGSKCIVIVHDLIFFVYPEWTGLWGRLWRFLLPYSINKNVQLFSISANTACDIPRYIPSFNTDIPITEIVLGYDRTVFNANGANREFLAEHQLPQDLQYIMFVGNAEPRRNLDSVIKALAAANTFLGQEFHLVVAGKNDHCEEQIMQTAEKEGAQDYVHIVGYLDDERLASFYRIALAYVYPSFYEGFGLTVVEAMGCGCPVITSNNSSLKDVAGDAALLVDPADQEQITAALTRVLSDAELRACLIQRGYENIKKYDWDKMMETILTTLEGLTANANHR
ncbi:glycosyltransferase family 4 protein [Geobacter sp. FeAm09]|uniref:glycosyltransferase family 4 protein n=1 Tax=Geobacter sp. FeAm09 TaxID=2597769 RepID=UPI0011F01CFF|nr:glycosyltransferase family 1 protein [Geobacter sp. FeAm09]QEM66878.1 glycosyltransferase family 4 protein [Geobacter sp. FeAm09]